MDGRGAREIQLRKFPQPLAHRTFEELAETHRRQLEAITSPIPSLGFGVIVEPGLRAMTLGEVLDGVTSALGCRIPHETNGEQEGHSDHSLERGSAQPFIKSGESLLGNADVATRTRPRGPACTQLFFSRV